MNAFAWVVVLHALGTTAGLLVVLRLAVALVGREPSWPIRRDYGAGGVLVVVGLGLRFLLVETPVRPPALDGVATGPLRTVGVVLALLGTGVCLWALARLRRGGPEAPQRHP